MKIKDMKVIPIQAIPRPVKMRLMDEIINEKQQKRKNKIQELQKKYGLSDKS